MFFLPVVHATRMVFRTGSIAALRYDNGELKVENLWRGSADEPSIGKSRFRVSRCCYDSLKVFRLAHGLYKVK